MDKKETYKKNIVNWFKKYQLVFYLALFVALAAGFFNWRQSGQFSVSSSLTLSRAGAQNADDYKYDNYYALLATDEFGDTVAGWFKTPELAQAVAKKIGGAVPKNLSDLSGRYKATKISPNVVEIRYGAQNEQEAKKINGAIADVLHEKTNALNSLSGQGISFTVLAGEPVIIKNSFNLILSAVAGFFVGLFFGFFVLAAREYFKN